MCATLNLAQGLVEEDRALLGLRSKSATVEAVLKAMMGVVRLETGLAASRRR